MASNYLISIHALREEGDRTMAWTRTGWGNFNPRPPRGGRPRPAAVWKAWRAFQSTPSARRATQLPPLVVGVAGYFNPRPPRGGRLQESLALLTVAEFQSTPSARRATKTVGDRHKALEISIHALREEGDCLSSSSKRFFMISIHALREEGDPWHPGVSAPAHYFNPRPPRGGRLPAIQRSGRIGSISIHALREEGDNFRCGCFHSSS